jgi:hypothetical protein
MVPGLDRPSFALRSLNEFSASPMVEAIGLLRRIDCIEPSDDAIVTNKCPSADDAGRSKLQTMFGKWNPQETRRYLRENEEIKGSDNTKYR